jgi:putative serine protease PepD
MLRVLTTALALAVLAACTTPVSQSPPVPSQSPTPAGSAATAGRALPVNSGAGTLQDQFVSVVAKVGPSVVVIQTDQGLGSGTIYDGGGDIVTNYHVVAGATAFQVTLGDGRSASARLVGSFPPDDLAVVKVSLSGLHPATFGDSDSLKVGDIVMAIGNPLGLQSSVTEGIVSALGRQLTEPGGIALPPSIQTSAAINPGNSGGALVDLEGAVVGVPTLAAQDPEMGGAAPGIGFAIPSNVVKDIAGQLIRDGRVSDSHRAYLGVRTAALNGAPGVLVYSVVSGGPADKAGVRPGDVITAVGGKPTPDPQTLAEVLAGLNPGQTVAVDLIKANGSRSTVQVTLGELPG